jgi:hypothetical protein
MQANSGLAPPLGRDSLLPDPSLFIVFTPSFLPTLHNLDIGYAVEYSTTRYSEFAASRQPYPVLKYCEILLEDIG